MGSGNPKSASEKNRDLLLHLEAYLAKRDGIDKLLKISRYTTKIIILASSSSSPLISRIKSFESSVGVSRKAFRLGKFVQDFNALRLSSSSKTLSGIDRGFTYLAYGGEGIYYFVEQFVWLVKTGLIPKEYGNRLQKISAWAELVGYVGSVALKISEVRRIKSGLDEEKETEAEKRRLREKLVMKQMSIIQDFADALMALGDVREGKGALTGPILMASAGLLSAIISTHKNWQSC